MLKNLSSFQAVVEGKLFQFFCDPDSPTNHVKDALNQFIHAVIQIEEHVAKMKENESENKIEELKEEAQ